MSYFDDFPPYICMPNGTYKWIICLWYPPFFSAAGILSPVQCSHNKNLFHILQIHLLLLRNMKSSTINFWIYSTSTFKSWDSFYKHQHLIKIFFEENKFVDESGCLFHNDRELLSLVRPHSAPTIKLQHPHKPPPLYYTCKLKMQKLTHISPFLVFLLLRRCDYKFKIGASRIKSLYIMPANWKCKSWHKFLHFFYFFSSGFVTTKNKVTALTQYYTCKLKIAKVDTLFLYFFSKILLKMDQS